MQIFKSVESLFLMAFPEVIFNVFFISHRCVDSISYKIPKILFTRSLKKRSMNEYMKYIARLSYR